MKQTTATAQHTPGPWTFREQGDANDWCILADGGRRWVIGFMQNGEMMPAAQEANARLIAAAPDLLTWLRKAVQMAEDQAKGGEDVPMQSAWRWLAEQAGKHIRAAETGAQD